MDHYKLSQCKEVQIAERELSAEISELKTALAETKAFTEKERGSGKITYLNGQSFVPLSSEYFTKMRNFSIKNQLSECDVLNVKKQSQTITDELDSALHSDITLSSLPLLLHQFFVDEVKRYVQCYHAQMLRWKRYSEHVEVLSWMYAKYKLRLVVIKKRYEDAKRRAHRLEASNLSYLLKDNFSSNCMEPDDIAIFLRWLVFHLRCTKKVFSFIRLLQWLPVASRHTIHMETFALQPQQTTGINIVEATKSDARSAWMNMTAGMDFSCLSPTASSHKASASNSASTVLVCDQSFAGFISNETTLGIPCHVIELSNFREHLDSLIAEYGITLRAELISSSDEMELFGTVNRHFKNLLKRQTECNIFYQYDNVPDGYSHWGVDCATHCLKKPSNWVEYINIKPRRRACQLQQVTCLKEDGNLDELLASHNRFLDVSDYSKVTEALKDHAIAVREPPLVKAMWVISNPKGKLSSNSVWNSIYRNPKTPEKRDSTLGKDSDEFAKGDRRFRRHTKKESYNYLNTLQMLGLDEGEDSSTQDPSVIQGAYLSYLHLRHLKIRDLRRECLSILNYFRSIERTLTIYNGGLSHEDTSFKLDHKIEKAIADDTRRKKIRTLSLGISDPEFTERAPPSRGLSSHVHMHDKPGYFKVDEEKFMKFSDVENHDDFYSLDKSSDDASGSWWKSAITSTMACDGHSISATPHVQDHRGFYIVYEAALQDLKSLTDELLLLASYYIEKDKINRTVRRSAAEKEFLLKGPKEDVDLAEYAHRAVDRFAVLLDLWTCEQNFLINKRKLLDCYVEAFHNTFDADQRRNLTQIITDIIYQRPRYDLTDDYFVRSYRGECTCLNIKTNLFTQVLSSHMEDTKCYLRRTARPADLVGMPMYCPSKQEVTVNLPKPALKHVDMFEFHPHIGIVASRLYDAIEVACHKVQMIKRPTHMCELVSLEKQVLEHSLHDWETMPVMGSSFSEQVQRDLFSDDFIEDVYLVDDAVESFLRNNQEDIQPEMAKKNAIKMWSNAVDTVLIRHRLVEATWETEVVSKIYKKVTSQSGFDECHLYSRPLHFENETRRKKMDPNPTTMSSFAVHDIMADKYVPLRYGLAIQELDSVHLAQFSFQNSFEFLELVQSSDKLQTVRVALACQITHKNLLITAITQSENCCLWKDAKPGQPHEHGNYSSRESVESHSKLSEALSSITQRSLQFFTSQTSKKLSVFGSAVKHLPEKHKRAAETFISAQLMKVGPRGVIANSFINERENNSNLMKKPLEVEALKRNLAADFCREVTFRTSLHAMRAQIIACYSGILTAISSYPSMRERFFMVGSASEVKTKSDDVTGMVPDPKVFRKRPRRVLSADGKAFLNLWFIPHYTEILSCYQNQDWEVQEHILNAWLSIAISLHDIVLFLCARARLNRVSSLKNPVLCESVAPIYWEEAEVVGIQLNEIQEQINHLDSEPCPHTKVPVKVAELLSMKKQILFHQFDVAVKFSLREFFLMLNKNEAYQCVIDNMTVALTRLNNVVRTNLTAIQLNLPKALLAHAKDALMIMPWLRFQHFNGSHCTAYCDYWEDPYSCMLLCFAGLNKRDRRLAIGALQHVDTDLKRVLHDGIAASSALQELPEEVGKGFMMSIQVGKHQSLPLVSQASHDPLRQLSSAFKLSDLNVPNAARNELRKKKEPKYDPELPLNKLRFPIDACRLLKTYLRLWKQLECFKLDWAKAKFNCTVVDRPDLQKQINRAYKTEIMLPVYSDMADLDGSSDLYDDSEDGDSPLQPPTGSSILACKAKLLKKLLQLHELRAISDARQMMRREFRSLLLSERTRKQSDVKGRPSVEFDVIIDKPLLVDDFAVDLLSQGQSTSNHITFDVKHLNDCLTKLASSAVRKEKDDFTNFTSRFDDLLRHYDNLLETKNLQTKCSEAKHLANFGIKPGTYSQYQLADRSPELIMEVTALRAKVAEMNEQLKKLAEESREDARSDCEDLIRNLFDACFEMKACLAQRYLTIIENINNMIAKIRAEALKKIVKVKNMDLVSCAEERLKTLNNKERKVAKLLVRTTRLDECARRVQSIRTWQLFTKERRHNAKVEELLREFSRLQRVTLSKNFTLNAESEYYFQELMKIRKFLHGTDEELVYGFAEKQRRKNTSKEKEYKELMAKANRRTFAEAEHYNQVRLAEEIREKDKRLQIILSELQRRAAVDEKKQQNMKSALKDMSSQLSKEQSLRVEASEIAVHIEENKSNSFNRSLTPALITLTRPTTSSFSSDRSSLSLWNRSRSVGSAPLPTRKQPLRERPYSCMPSIFLREPVASLPKKKPFTSTEDLKARLSTAIRRGYYPAQERE